MRSLKRILLRNFLLLLFIVFLLFPDLVGAYFLKDLLSSLTTWVRTPFVIALLFGGIYLIVDTVSKIFEHFFKKHTGFYPKILVVTLCTAILLYSMVQANERMLKRAWKTTYVVNQKIAETTQKLEEEYFVEVGDTLWDIAERRYGDGFKWSLIAEKNQLANPDIISPNQKLLVPAINESIQ